MERWIEGLKLTDFLTPLRLMSVDIFRFSLPCLLAPAILVTFVSCEDPVNVSTAPSAPETRPAADPAPTPAATPTEPAPASPPETPPPAPAEPPAPLIAIVDVLEDETAKKITLSGQVSSRYQIQDLVERFTYEFPDYEIIHELKHEPELQDLNWMNRADDYLIPFLQSVENAHFHYQEGVTRLEGTVETQAHVNLHSKMVIEILSDTDSRSLENLLKAKDSK